MNYTHTLGKHFIGYAMVLLAVFMADVEILDDLSHRVHKLGYAYLLIRSSGYPTLVILRQLITTAILLATIAGPCLAWYQSDQNNFDSQLIYFMRERYTDGYGQTGTPLVHLAPLWE